MLEGEGRVVLLAFGVTVACVSPFPDGANAPRWALLSLVPFLVRPSLLLLAIAAAPALTLAWSPDPIAGLDLAWHFLLLALLVAITPADLTKIYWAVGAGVAINSAVVAAQMAGFDPVSRLADQTVTGLFFNRNQQNDFVALAVIGLLSLRDWRGYALAAWVALPLFASPIARTPLVALTAAGIVALRGWWRLAGIAAAAILLLVLAGASGRAMSNLQRLDTWIDAAQHLTAFGRGLGGFRFDYPEMEYAHNDFLQIAYELGIPGLVGAVGLLCYSLRCAVPTERLILTAFVVEGCFDFPLYWPTTGMLAALCVGAALRCRAGIRRPVANRERAGDAGKIAPRPA